VIYIPVNHAQSIAGPKCLYKDCTDVIVLITISPKMIPASYPGQLMLVVSLYSCSVRFRAGERLRPPTIRNDGEAVPGQLHQQIKSEISINNDTRYPLKSCTYTIRKRGYHHITTFLSRFFRSSPRKRRSKNRS
jgi:hypothetical protein